MTILKKIIMREKQRLCVALTQSKGATMPQKKVGMLMSAVPEDLVEQVLAGYHLKCHGRYVDKFLEWREEICDLKKEGKCEDTNGWS